MVSFLTRPLLRRAAVFLGLALSAAVPATAGAATRATAAPPPEKPSPAKGYQPNMPLVTQDGKAVKFYDDLIKDRVVLIHFMFTTCQSICPPMVENLRKVQQILQPALGDELGKRFLILSISVDPETDTPAVLKAYADRRGVGPGWLFLTGKRADVETLLAKLGEEYKDKFRHSGMALIGSDAARSFKKVFAMAPPEELAETMRKMAALPRAAAQE